MLGMPASVSVVNSITRISFLLEAYSFRYTAAPTPMGSTISSVSRIMYNVLSRNGRMPCVPLVTLGTPVISFQLMAGKPLITT